MDCVNEFLGYILLRLQSVDGNCPSSLFVTITKEPIVYICFDAAYSENKAVACGIAFSSIDSSVRDSTYLYFMTRPAPYIPGSFYLREMPLIIGALDKVRWRPSLIFIDGYVWLPGKRPGLGAHLFFHLHEEIPVIGIAKSPYRGHSSHKKIIRGMSKRPLYITAAGVEDWRAAEAVTRMAGDFRIPDMMTTAHSEAKRQLRYLNKFGKLDHG